MNNENAKCKVTALWEKMGPAEPQTHKFMINKHEKLCVGVYQTVSSWLNIVWVIKQHTVHDGGGKRGKQKTWSFSALLSACSYTPIFMVPLQPPSHAAVWGTYLQDCRPQINKLLHHPPPGSYSSQQQ